MCLSSESSRQLFFSVRECHKNANSPLFTLVERQFHFLELLLTDGVWRPSFLTRLMPPIEDQIWSMHLGCRWGTVSWEEEKNTHNQIHLLPSVFQSSLSFLRIISTWRIRDRYSEKTFCVCWHPISPKRKKKFVSVLSIYNAGGGYGKRRARGRWLRRCFFAAASSGLLLLCFPSAAVWSCPVCLERISGLFFFLPLVCAWLLNSKKGEYERKTQPSLLLLLFCYCGLCRKTHSGKKLSDIYSPACSLFQPAALATRRRRETKKKKRL